MASKIRELMIASSTSPFLLWPEPRLRLRKQDSRRPFKWCGKSSKPRTNCANGKIRTEDSSLRVSKFPLVPFLLSLSLCLPCQ